MATKTPESLMREAVIIYNAVEERYQSIGRLVRSPKARSSSRLVTYASRNGELEEVRNVNVVKEYMRLKRIKEAAWVRYLRRWADARENGYQGDWFAPWLHRVSK